MRNRKEQKMVCRGNYVGASWYRTQHCIRLGRWATKQVLKGNAVDFS